MAGPAGEIKHNPKVDSHSGIRPLTGTAGAAISSGALLKDNGSGLLIHATAAGDELVGIAACGASASGDKVSFYPWFPGLILEVYANDGTNVGATAPATTDTWTKFGFGVDSSTGKFFLNLVDTTEKQLVIVGLIDASGTTNGRVLASPIFNPANSGSAWAL